VLLSVMVGIAVTAALPKAGKATTGSLPPKAAETTSSLVAATHSYVYYEVQYKGRDGCWHCWCTTRTYARARDEAYYCACKYHRPTRIEKYWY